MTPSQRYFFDVAGYLHIKNALTEKELSDGRLACERYMKLEDNQFPDGLVKMVNVTLMGLPSTGP